MITPRRLLSILLGLFVVLSLPNHRAEGALLSATNLDEFRAVQGEYKDCIIAGNSLGKCFKMVLDPEGVDSATVDLTFPSDAVTFIDTIGDGGLDSVDAVITGLNGYNVMFDPADFKTDQVMVTLQNIKVKHTSVPPDNEPLDLMHVELAHNPESDFDTVLFTFSVTDVILVGGGTLVDPMMPRMAAVRIATPEPSTLSMLAAFFLGVVPLRRALLKK